MNPPEPKPIRLLVVDDHNVVRLGLRTLLNRHTDIEVVGEAGTVASAVEETARAQPDLVLMDVRLPDGDRFEACRQIRRAQPETRVLFLTSFADEKIVLESIDAGGDGFLLKGQIVEARSFMAYDLGFTGGVFVAAGDFNGDGRCDVITGAAIGTFSGLKVVTWQHRHPGNKVDRIFLGTTLRPGADGSTLVLLNWRSPF